MTIRYTTSGSVRGSCGHRHRSLATAWKCAEADHRAVKRGHGPNAYSDRVVLRSDGMPLSERELEDIADMHGEAA